MKEKQIIGRTEIAAFPLLSLEDVTVKIDTGAYSSAIHCSHIGLNSDQNLEVIFLDETDSGFTGKIETFEEFDKRKIKSSSGHSEVRFAINTTLGLGKHDYPIRVTLADRSIMRIPVLIGRRFLKKNKFVVDPQHINLFAGKN
jgi:hypothetical protein